MNRFSFDDFFAAAERSSFAAWTDDFKSAIMAKISKPDGNLPRWETALDSLPELTPHSIKFDLPAVTIKTGNSENSDLNDRLRQALLQLSPWRKGPFRINDVSIDTEWRSDMKWDRVKKGITDLKGRTVLDIGCGNGYYMFRMLEQGPAMVVGADPSLLFLCQFAALKKYCGPLPVFLLPIGFEDIPENMQVFDSVFSMGVFYHRRSPFDFLRSLRLMLRKGGELILETLVIEGDENQVLVPGDRYARMNNVWFIPSAKAMTHWLAKSGFCDIKEIDVCRTTLDEQRKTEWMPGESLEMCLDPHNPSLTVEGHPAPLRAVFTCKR